MLPRQRFLFFLSISRSVLVVRKKNLPFSIRKIVFFYLLSKCSLKRFDENWKLLKQSTKCVTLCPSGIKSKKIQQNQDAKSSYRSFRFPSLFVESFQRTRKCSNRRRLTDRKSIVAANSVWEISFRSLLFELREIRIFFLSVFFDFASLEIVFPLDDWRSESTNREGFHLVR